MPRFLGGGSEFFTRPTGQFRLTSEILRGNPGVFRRTPSVLPRFPHHLGSCAKVLGGDTLFFRNLAFFFGFPPIQLTVVFLSFA